MSTFRTSANQWQKVFAANAADTSFPAKIPTTTAPTANAGFVTLPLNSEDRTCDSNLLVLPYGTGADNATFDFRIYSWRFIGSLWMPTILGEWTAALSALVGIAGATDGLIETERLADTLTLAAAYSEIEGVSAQTMSLANDVCPATLSLDLKGARYLEFTGDRTGATAFNFLIAGY